MRCLAVLMAALMAAPVAAARPARMATAAYAQDGSDFANPERGFSLSSGPPARARAANLSLIHVYFRLDEYRDAPLPPRYLDEVRRTFAEARDGGVKIIPRFTYNFPAGPPYTARDADAPLARVLEHLDQLAPVLQDNSDVIAFMEAGFIGAWGEWHHSANGLETIQAKRAVLQKLLRILPPSRMVALRYLRDKVAIFGRSAPLRTEEAFGETDVARVGHHNDCFLAARDDYDTYRLDAPGGLAGQKRYLAEETRYVPQGGETCNAARDAQPFIDCANAVSELQAQHWSQLNRDYHPDVLNLWRREGCFPEISRRLGYRFRLLGASLQIAATAGGVLRGRVRLVNDGFASPYNPRGLELVLRNRATGATYPLRLGEDPRRWTAGAQRLVRIEARLPGAMAPGVYEALLNLPDPAPDLHDRPAYSIRLANPGVWEPATGYNALRLTTSVQKQP